jgi:hypothetical protein
MFDAVSSIVMPKLGDMRIRREKKTPFEPANTPEHISSFPVPSLEHLWCQVDLISFPLESHDRFHLIPSRRRCPCPRPYRRHSKVPNLEPSRAREKYI